MTTQRAVRESPLKQGEDERIAYILTVTPWGSNPYDVSVKIYDKNRVDCSSTCLTGDATINEDEITTPVVYNLNAGKIYRLEIKFTIAGNVLEAYAPINGEY
jgi:hypothetical protein